MAMFGGFGGGGLAGFAGGGLNDMLRGFGQAMDDDERFAASPDSYDEHFRAYSMAMLPGRERLNVSYGGKIIMPTSALGKLTHMGIEMPWLFELSNVTGIQADYRVTHAGVLEFIAEDGNVHLPAWMMRQLKLEEGSTIRIHGKTMPKGKMVKIQPQTVDFLEIADPKAVLEQAFRNFSALTKGDIVEISYNCLTFEILIMEIKPDAECIKIIDTDLEVDFAPPKGYVEPAPKPRPPPPTMASKLNIDKDKVDSIPASGTSTPRSADASGGAEAAAAGPFRGAGNSLSGKKLKPKKEKPIEGVDKDSLIRRTDQPRIVTNDTQLEDKKVPAALRLPFGKLFFGYAYVDPAEAKAKAAGEQETMITFAGSGQTLSGRAPKPKPEAKKASKDAKVKTSRRLDGKEVIEIDEDDE